MAQHMIDLREKRLIQRKYLGKTMLSKWKHVENLETLQESVDNTDDNCIDLGCRDAQNDEN